MIVLLSTTSHSLSKLATACTLGAMNGQHRSPKPHPGFTTKPLQALWLTPYTLGFWIAALVVLGRAGFISLFS